MGNRAAFFVIHFKNKPPPGFEIPRKGGPGITKSDLLIINKIDIVEQMHASLAVLERDSTKMRVERPLVFTNLYDRVGLETIINFIFGAGHADGTLA